MSAVRDVNGRVSGFKLTQLIVTILMAVCLPFIGWLSLTVIEHEALLQRTDGNRFTAQDGAALRNLVDARLDRLELAGSTRDARIEAMASSAERVSRTMERFADILDRVEKRLDRMEAHAESAQVRERERRRGNDNDP